MTDLEPAERDPKAIRRTLLLLIAMMLGGILVTNSYIKTLAEQNKNDRPGYEGELTKNLHLMRHDNRLVNLGDLDGQVWLCAQVVTTQAETGELTRSIMRELSKKYETRSDVRFLLLTINPEFDKPDVLAVFAEKEGLALPDWWLCSVGDGDKLRKYIKNELRFGLFPMKKADGRWEFDTSLVVIGRNRKIRGRVDFDQELIDAKKRDEDPQDALDVKKQKLEQDINYLIENS